jgi:hypothetical protein
MLRLVLIAFGTVGAAITVEYFDLGGIRVSWPLLAIGLLLASAAQTLMDFGSRLQNRRLEYSGTTVQGMAWWVWLLNLPYLAGQHGLHAVLHWGVPLLLFVAIPTVLHYLNNEVLTEALATRIVRRRKVSNAMPILIIEPGRDFGVAVTADLIANNYTAVEWVTGISSISPFIGILPSGKPIELDPLKYRLVFTDYLKTDPIEAPEVVQMLSSRGIVCVGISVEKRLNAKLVEDYGAKTGILKGVFLQGLLDKTFSPDELVKNPDLSGIMRELAELEVRMHASSRARRTAGALLDLVRTDQT